MNFLNSACLGGRYVCVRALSRRAVYYLAVDAQVPSLIFLML